VQSQAESGEPNEDSKDKDPMAAAFQNQQQNQKLNMQMNHNVQMGKMINQMNPIML
jgi:hypothetical protein